MLSVSLIPAVSVILHMIPFMIILPSTMSLVVPSISVTMAFSSSRRVFKRLLLPTFGLPIIPILIPSLISFPSSDLIIMILNNNERITTEELDLLSKIKNKNHIIVINKTDLENKLNLYVEDAIKISIKDNTGIEDIKKRISEIFNLDKISTQDMSYLSNARSISLLKISLNKIDECLNNIKNEVPIDIIELDLKECWNTLGEIIGETYTDELIDEIFSRFCLGK